MPIIQDRVINVEKKLIVWQITESVAELMEMYGEDVTDKLKGEGINHESRRKEWLIQRLILKHYPGTAYTLHKHTSGAPYLKSDNNPSIAVSISHTKGYVAMLFTQGDWCGVDIEQEDDRAVRIAGRFLSDKEQEQFLQTGRTSASMLWSCKEAAFKTYNRENIEFKKDIVINSIQGSTANVSLPLLGGSNEFQFALEYIDKHVLVYLVNP